MASIKRNTTKKRLNKSFTKPILGVLWHDTVFLGGSWSEADKIKSFCNEGNFEVCTVGILIEQQDDYIVLAPCLASDLSSFAIVKIPTGAIVDSVILGYFNFQQETPFSEQNNKHILRPGTFFLHGKRAGSHQILFRKIK
ncbi:MAG: hypothetical protein QXH92_04010 [Candidatus Aenigmatarchaeota archaeon]